MMNWKRIIAAAGTAALLISNMGSVTQLAFATEPPITEPAESSEGDGVSGEPEEPTVQDEPVVQAEEPDKEVADTPAAGEGEGSGESGVGTTGTENGETGSGTETGSGNTETAGTETSGSTEGGNTNEGAGESSEAGSDGSTDTGSESTPGENAGTTGEQTGDSTASGSETNEGTGESDDAKGTDENQTTDGTTVTPGTDAETPADGEVVNPTDPAAEEIDPEEPAEDEEDEETITYALDDSLTVELETKESGKRDVVRDEDDNAYLYDLGETASTTVTLTNPADYALDETDGAVVRVYMQFTDNEPEDTDETSNAQDSSDVDASDETVDEQSSADNGSDSKKGTDPEALHGKTSKPGDYTVETEAEDGEESNTYTYTVSEVEDGLYCYEIERPIHGDTISFEMTSVYGKDSNGGANQIWAVIIPAEKDDTDSEDNNVSNEETAEAEANKTTEPERLQEQILRWIGETKATADNIQVETATTDHYVISVAYGPNANIPDDAELRVKEYNELYREYAEIQKETGKNINWLLDIGFYIGDEEIEPNETISISVAPRDTEEENADTLITEERALDKAASLVSDEKAERQSIQSDEEVNEVELIHYAEAGDEKVTAERDTSGVTTFSIDSLSMLVSLDDGIMTAAETTVSSNENQKVTVPDKITYSDTEEPSGKIEGSTSIEGLGDSIITYVSDPATSDIEDDFQLVKSQDGKVLTDKSVTYGKDDYSSGLTYEDGEFGVTLSALAQEYNYEGEDSVVAPIDVVFILDTSASMENNNRQTPMVAAVNDAIQRIMDNHPANRIGVVTFSSGSWEFLSLDRYVANSEGKFLTELSSSNSTYGNFHYVNIASGVKKESGENVSQKSLSTNDISAMHCGTYTQAGIAQGYKTFSEGKGTTYTATFKDGTEQTVTRKPVIVLLSDGEPTYCNTAYDNVLNSTGTIYGDGQGNDSRDAAGQGIMGFYAIQSANYYKRQVSQKYYSSSTGASFYTIGMGIAASGYSDGNAVGDDYRRAVLNPTSTNVGVLNQGSSVYSNARRYRTSRQLKDLLEGVSAKDVANVSSERTWGGGTNYYIDALSTSGTIFNFSGVYNTGTKIPIQSNAYSSDYAYAENAFFGNLSEEDLKTYFFSILAWNQSIGNYVTSIKKDSSLKLEDPIGEGMEVKGNSLYLRYGSQNYELVKDESNSTESKTVYKLKDSNTTVKYTDVYPENRSQSGGTGDYIVDDSAREVKVGDSWQKVDRKDLEIDLSRISVTVTTDNDGNQTVRMEVPEDIMPIVHPERYGQFYYRELPVRLIYKVGLTEAAIEEANNKTAQGESVDYYTNRYSDDGNGNKSALSSGSFTEGTFDTYNFAGDQAVAKSENATGTTNNSFDPSYTPGSSTGAAGSISQGLGNNGKISIGPKPSNTNIKAVKEWTDSSASHVGIQVGLYRNGELQGNTVALDSSNSWTYTWENLPNKSEDKTVNYEYEVKEVAVDGYAARYEHTYDPLTNTTTWKITNTPRSSVGVEVVKQWLDADGNPMQTAPDTTVTGTLKRNKAERNTGVTVNLVFNYRTGNSYSGYTWHPTEVQTITVATGSSFSYYFTNDRGNRINSQYYTPDVSDSSVATATVNSDNNNNRYVSVDITGKNGDSVTITVGVQQVYSTYNAPQPRVAFSQNYTSPSGMGTYQEDVGWSRPIELNSANNWTQFWTSEELEEDNSQYSYSYWVEEDAVSGYKTTINCGNSGSALVPSESGKTITITNTQETTSLNVEKKWVETDGQTRDHASDTVTVWLYQDGVKTEQSVTLNQGNSWKGTFSNLPVVDPATGKDYKYTVEEKPVDGYDATYAYTPETTETTPSVDSQKPSVTITNTQKKTYELPSTGGMGTTPFEVCGSAALLASMFAGCSSLWRRRRDGRRCE